MKLNPRQTATDMADMSNKVAQCIENAIDAELPHDADLLSIYAHRIRLCNSLGNIWTASDLTTNLGECFDGSGRFWYCGSKLCSYCLQRQSQRNRKMLRTRIRDQKLMVGEHWHFLTLTMPNQGIPLLEARHIFNLAWALFRKKTWFTSTVIGYAKSEEFTMTRKTPHYHAHVLARSRFINYSSMRHFWTESLRSAFARVGKTLSVATSDHMAVANCRRVGSLDDAVKEVAKYLTKSTSWQKIPTDQLLDLCRIRRWPRMFELGGSLRSDSAVAVLEEDDAGLKKDYLDTKSLSDEEPDWNWRDKVTKHGVAAYLDKLHDAIGDQSRIRIEQLKHHFPYAKFRRLKPQPTENTGQILERIVSRYDRSGHDPPWTLDIRNISNAPIIETQKRTIVVIPHLRPAEPDGVHLSDYLENLYSKSSQRAEKTGNF